MKLDGSIESYYPGKPQKIVAIDFDYKKKINKRTIDRIVSFIRTYTIGNGHFDGAVVGLSDGLDGATATSLCLKALGRGKVLAVIIVSSKTKEGLEFKKLAVESAKAMGVDYVIVDITKIFKDFTGMVSERSAFADVNIATRAVQNVLFQIADERNYAVISTINKSEWLTGRMTEGFYGHLAPLSNFFKSEIFDLARAIKISEEIISRKPGGVDTWYDEDTFGVTYDILDKMLYLLVVKKMTPARIAKAYKFDKKWIEKLKIRTDHRFWRLTTKELES